MRLVVFGLTVSSSWGNGHATVWRALCRALGELGHGVVFFERDVPYYRDHRDAVAVPGCELRLYRDFDEVAPIARRALDEADVGMVTSYCPDGLGAAQLVLESRAAVRAFYDLDTPVTLARLEAGEPVPYLPRNDLRDFDLVFSFTGGAALDLLRTQLGARRAVALYGSVDPAVHRPTPPDPRFRADLSYLGTYAADRQPALDALFLAPARLRPGRRFTLAGSLYPQDFPWAQNVYYFRHLPPGEHASFYGSSRLTLNVTRGAMATLGHCPSGRLFEAAACGAPVVSDTWEGLADFFQPGAEILTAESTDDVARALDLSDAELRRVAAAARARVLTEHTGDARARALLAAVEEPGGAPAAGRR